MAPNFHDLMLEKTLCILWFYLRTSPGSCLAINIHEEQLNAFIYIYSVTLVLTKVNLSSSLIVLYCIYGLLLSLFIELSTVFPSLILKINSLVSS